MEKASTVSKNGRLGYTCVQEQRTLPKIVTTKNGPSLKFYPWHSIHGIYLTLEL